MKYLAFIPARGGSKGIQNKNLSVINGSPLIDYSFQSAKESHLVSAVHLSSDDEQIITLAKHRGIISFYKRPEHLASDEAKIIDVILYHLQWLEENNQTLPENIVLLQPTSPIRKHGLIDRCIEAFEKSGRETLIAVSNCIQHPYETFCIENEKLSFINKNVKRRQDYPAYYFITGSVYIATVSFIRKNKLMFDENSATQMISEEESVDIDNASDLLLAEFLLKKINE